MKKHNVCRIAKAVSAIGVVLLVGTANVTPVFSDSGDEYKKMPGYVDFGQLAIFDKVEPKVEVFIKGPLLKLCMEAVRNEDPDLANALNEIKLVRVHVFELEGSHVADLSTGTRKLASKLEKKGWEMAVRVREEGENVYVYLLPGERDDIAGLVVMVIEDDDEAVFVNIVGNIDPEQLGRLSRSINIDGLDLPQIESHLEKNDTRRTEP